MELSGATADNSGESGGRRRNLPHLVVILAIGPRPGDDFDDFDDFDGIKKYDDFGIAHDRSVCLIICWFVHPFVCDIPSTRERYHSTTMLVRSKGSTGY